MILLDVIAVAALICATSFAAWAVSRPLMWWMAARNYRRFVKLSDSACPGMSRDMCLAWAAAWASDIPERLRKFYKVSVYP